MDFPPLQDLQPYLVLITASLSIVVLGFILHLAMLLKESLAQRLEAVRDQKVAVEERLKGAQEELARSEKLYEQKIVDLREQLQTALERNGISSISLITGAGLKEELSSAVREALSQMLAFEKTTQVEDPEWHLSLAQALFAQEKWAECVDHLNQSLKSRDGDWKTHFMKAAAAANSRAGDDMDLVALREISVAIALAPKTTTRELLARMYSYRGGVLKRQNRLEEAETNLNLARRWAGSDQHVIEDVTYNLACIYSMMSRKEEMLTELQKLIAIEPLWRQVIATKKRYFESYWTDCDFRTLVRL